ncbi:prolyl oligopeptidase family domain-containing protein [Trichoderma breve]|uniref:Dipeptidyl-peptidase V n=1 Tax=Trichoderma breve TaxID=2034170 RepID=A0A9W9B7H2_9HYPO|nr:prolyl oligopeptidase family domain-containing protein [Trichoderma breve]KAJ4858023.1 prolyl oligopeptidase family domain-containing protein [Trichoderma breve]
MTLRTLENGERGQNSCGVRNHDYPLAEVPDIADSQIWKQVEGFFTKVHAPSFGQLSNAEDLAVSPDGTRLAFTGYIWSSLKDGPKAHVYIVDLPAGSSMSADPVPMAVSHGPHNNKKPKWSPDGKMLVFLSDRIRAGQYQLFYLRSDRLGEAQPLVSEPLQGIIEDFSWSHDGSKILIGLAAFGLPKSGFEGSGTLVDLDVPRSQWTPIVKTDHAAMDVRSLWLHDLQSHQTRRISLPGRNIWRFAWCGPQDAVAIVSDRPGEGAYKESSLVKISLSNCVERVMVERGEYFMAQPTASPSGSKVAFVESVGGDRTKLAGCIVCVDSKTNKQTRIASNVDISSLEWFNEETLFSMGLRDLTSVALKVDVLTHEPAGLPGGGFAVVRQGWELQPEIGLVSEAGAYTRILSFEDDGGRWLRPQLGQSHAVSWESTDGLKIQGFLYLPPKGQKPYPLILNVHGGPMSAFIDQWMGYRTWVAFLVAQGYAVLNANPRGSLGRGRKFTQGVVGDVGGGDATDLLKGLDYLVSSGVADASRLGVIGGSYGGFQSAWLTTLTNRFAAAIPISPVSDWNLQWLSSDLRQRTLDNRPYNIEMGKVDQCTPPAQAHYYHTALLDHGVKSCIVEYPKEGHGIRQFPALIDACCRMISWFGHFMPVDK